MAAPAAVQAALAAQERSLAEVRAALARAEDGHRQLAALVAAWPEPAAIPAAVVPEPVAAPVPVAVAEVPAEPATASSSVAPPAVLALCDSLEALRDLLAAHAVGVDPREVAFMGVARQVLTGADAQLEERLGDILRFTDQLGAGYLGAAYAPLQAALAEVRQGIAAAAPGLELLQAAGPLAGAAGPLLPVPAGIVLATGVRRQGVELQAPQAVRPATDPAPLARAAWALVDELYLALRGAFRRPLRDDLPRLVEIAGDLLARPDPHGLRRVLNAHTGHLESGDGPAATAALALLRKEAGWSALVLAAGERFDPERHDHKRFERVVRPQPGAASASVLAVRQIGLIDQSGLAVQRCILVTAP
jgi:hypothetical protein